MHVNLVRCEIPPVLSFTKVQCGLFQAEKKPSLGALSAYIIISFFQLHAFHLMVVPLDDLSLHNGESMRCTQLESAVLSSLLVIPSPAPPTHSCPVWLPCYSGWLPALCRVMVILGHGDVN